MNKVVKIAIVVVLLLAAAAYGYNKWKTLHPEAPAGMKVMGHGQAGSMMMRPGKPGGPGMPAPAPGK